MKKLLLILLLLPLISFGQLGEYYSSQGHLKTKGLTVQVRKPLGFDQMEADRPNIVQKWVKDGTDNSKLVTFNILVKYLPEEAQGFSKNEWTQYLKYESGISEMVEESNELGKAENEKYVKLDNYPGLFFEGYAESQRLDFPVRLYYYRIMVFDDKYIVSISMQSPVKSVLESNNRLFTLLSNSIIFPDQYR